MRALMITVGTLIFSRDVCRVLCLEFAHQTNHTSNRKDCYMT